jgi:Protein of unknown function (DUF1353)
VKLRTWGIAFAVLALAIPASAQEFFGEFKDPLKGEFVPADPRPKFKLQSDFRFSDPNGLLWETPAGSEVDGASIPQAFWSMIGGPFEGEYIRASVIHDYYCDKKLRTSHDTHRNFYYGMRTTGVPTWKAKLMYWAVDTFGPKWELLKKVVQEMRCRVDEGRYICAQESVEKIVNSPVASVDLSDPEVLAVALSKAATVARTLKTSDGAYLDITPAGAVSADLDSITNSAAQYRSLMQEKAFLQTPARLGVMSVWEGGGLDQVAPWKDGKLPSFLQVRPLTTKSLEAPSAGSAFRITPNSKDLLRDQLDLDRLRYEKDLPSRLGR